MHHNYFTYVVDILYRKQQNYSVGSDGFLQVWPEYPQAEPKLHVLREVR